MFNFILSTNRDITFARKLSKNKNIITNDFLKHSCFFFPIKSYAQASQLPTL